MKRGKLANATDVGVFWCSGLYPYRQRRPGHSITYHDIPWFSSTWTLQEAFIQPSATFIDRSGNYALATSGTPCTLEMVLAYGKQLHQLFTPSKLPITAGNDRDEVLISKRDLVRTLERVGLQALADNDRITLYSCARLRQPKNQNDWVYGIMQVWDFKLGEASPDGNRKTGGWTLDDLELELGRQLLSDFPVESQIQVHKSSVPNRQSWRISRHSSTPLHTLSFLKSGRLEGTVDRCSSVLGVMQANGIVYGHFEGKVCAFETLRKACENQGGYDVGGHPKSYPSNPVRIFLGETEVLNHTVLQARYSLQDVPENKQLELANTVSAHLRRLGRTASVLLLAIVRQKIHSVEITKAVGVIAMAAPDAVIGR